MFFTDNRKTLFRPLNSKYREQIVECLRTLYSRLYTGKADYRRLLTRDQVLEVFQEALARAPVLDDGNEDEYSLPVRSEREQANWVLKMLEEHGWLERHVDEATLHSTYAFTRVGRLFTQPMLETMTGRFRTRHRNTRNTRNALQSFVEQGEVYDLLDAFEYSERIISDFSDVIAELDERRRELVREVEAQQIVQRASDEFFDFMEKRFMPDLAVRLSADSVEKYRDEIQELITKARRKRKEFKVSAEQELRKLAPELLEHPQQSLYIKILDGIENRMHGASEIMLPALRHALHGFTRRADIIIRQLSYVSSGQQNQLMSACQALAALPEAEQERKLTTCGEQMAVVRVGVVDPGTVRLMAGRGRRVVHSGVESHEGEDDRDARRNLFLDRALEQAFTVNQAQLRAFVKQALSQDGRIHSQNLPVNNAHDLLMGAHVIEIASASGLCSEYTFRVEPTGQQASNPFFLQSDEFVIELVSQEHVE